MSGLTLYREEIRFLSKNELLSDRWEVWSALNGDAFFAVNLWPKDMRLAFYKKPTSDLQTFKLLLFCLGNGCSPYLIQWWILLTQAWKGHRSTAEKRALQVDFVLNNVERKMGTCFYFDMSYGKMFYLNGLPKNRSN